MAIIKQIETSQGILATYHSIFWYQGISDLEKDNIKAILKSYISKEKYLEGKESVEQTEISFDLTKDFEGSLRKEIYAKFKENEKFSGAEDELFPNPIKKVVIEGVLVNEEDNADIIDTDKP